MKSRDPRPISEAAVLKTVKRLLEAKGFVLFRRNVGALSGTHRGKKWFVKFADPGQSDLWGWYRIGASIIPSGMHIEVEIKAPGKKLTKAQDEWLRYCRLYGVLTMWCDSVQMAEAKLKEWGL